MTAIVKNKDIMEKQINFSVSADVARRSGLISVRYRTADGRFVLTDRDLQRVYLEGDEFVDGLDAVRLTQEEAERLVAENNFQMGEATDEETVQAENLEEIPSEAGEPSKEGSGSESESAQDIPEEQQVNNDSQQQTEEEE